MSDPVIRSSMMVLKDRATKAKLDFWEVLEIGVEVKDSMNAMAGNAPGGPPGPPVFFPSGPGVSFAISVVKVFGTPLITPATTSTPPAPPPPPPPTPEARREPTLQEKQIHADLVSSIEQVWWEGAATAHSAHDFASAHDWVVIGGQAEHFAANLSPVPDYVTQEESSELIRRLMALRDLAQKVGGTGYAGGAGHTENIDKIVNGVRGK